MKKFLSVFVAATMIFGALSLTSPKRAQAYIDPVLFSASAVTAVGLIVLAIVNYEDGNWHLGDLSVNMAIITSTTSGDMKKFVANQLTEDAAAFIVNDGANATGLLAATMNVMRKDLGESASSEASDLELAYEIIDAAQAL